MLGGPDGLAMGSIASSADDVRGTAVLLGERAADTSDDAFELAGFTETAATVLARGFLAAEPEPAEDLPPVLDAGRFLDRAFELAMVGVSC